jgi:hypothetical protein
MPTLASQAPVIGAGVDNDHIRGRYYPPMRCKSQVKIWNPEFINLTIKEPFKGPISFQVQCPTTTKVTAAKCWKKWKQCGHHAAQAHPADYPKGSAPRKGGGRYGNDNTYHLAFNQVVPERVRKKSNKSIVMQT